MKTYTARNSADALALARGDLGADAVVLRTRTYRRGGLFGVAALGGRPVVEVTAVSLAALQAAAKRREQRAGAARSGEAARAGGGPRLLGESAAGLRAAPAPLAGDLIRRTYAAARLDLDEPGAAAAAAAALSGGQERPQARPAPRAEASPRPPAPAGNLGPVPDLAGELAAVKALVARVAESQERESVRRAAPELFKSEDPAAADVYARLIRVEVAEELARRVASDAADVSGGVEAAVERLLGESVRGVEAVEGAKTGGPGGGAPLEAYRREPGADRPLTLALVGSTGVGKTTTVAKLAAQLKLRHRRDVGVVTLDTYRIGAVEQLRTYCSIIGTDLKVASNPGELSERLAELSACDVVLIDTAGRSPRDLQRVGELGGFLAAARPHQTHLVLSLAASAGVLRDATTRFGCVGPDRLILTKCDEAPGCGHALAVLEAAGLPVSFLTTGQEVPHDIEVAEAATLAKRLVAEPAEA